jgi:hypothetical protein
MHHRWMNKFASGFLTSCGEAAFDHLHSFFA